MSNHNHKKVRAVIAPLLAGKISEENAIDQLARTIGRAYFNGIDAANKAKARPQKKTRVQT